MKLIILGTSAAYSGKNDGCSSYLLTSEGKNYLLDTGPGCVSFLQNYIGIQDINGIFLSHLHADHVSDIYTMRYAVYTVQREGLLDQPIPIYMPKSPKKTYKFIRETIKNEFSIVEISESLKLTLGGMTVSFKKAEHPIDTFSMKFALTVDRTDKTLVYTADTGYHGGLISFCRNADIIVADATLQDKDLELENLGHMTARRAGELAREANVRKLVLTHFWPVYEKSTSLREAEHSFKKEIVIAQRGLELVL